MLISCRSVETPPVQLVPEPEIAVHPKNIVLMIGDGMGLGQLSAGLFLNGNKLEIERLPVTGLHKPKSAGSLISDSAAGATAFSTGQLVKNGVIALNEETGPMPSILELAEQHGKATGIVTTASIVHATPAAFYAHVAEREQKEDIAVALTQANINLFMGGGLAYFTQRSDEQNLLTVFEEQDYVIRSGEGDDLPELLASGGDKIAYFTGNKHPKPVEQGRAYFPTASRQACTFLNRKDKGQGFFLLLEGAQMDWAGHAQDVDFLVQEMLDFDAAVGQVMNFARKDGETLVIVTGDQETGGFAMTPGSSTEKLIPAFTTDKHTGTMIPVFAFGPGSELFSGIYDNTAIFEKMRSAWGF